MQEAPPISEVVALVRSPAVLWRGFPGHLVVATVDDELRRASGPAFEIWVELEQPIAVGELADILSHRHGVAREQILSDITPFLSEMVASGYVVITGSDRGG